MSKHFRVYWQTCVFFLFAAAASATTIVLPTDEQLVRKSPVIVEGTVISSMPVLRGEGIWTETRLAVDRTLKGDAAGELTIREIGGEIDGRITKIFGTPVYTPGERVMVFLTPTPRGDYQTIDLFVGKFSEQRAVNGRRLWCATMPRAMSRCSTRRFQPIAVEEHPARRHRVRVSTSPIASPDARARRTTASPNPVLRTRSRSDGGERYRKHQA